MEIRQTDQFGRWFSKLKNHEAKARISIRLRKIQLDGAQALGDCKPVGGKVFELRFPTGAGYRVYFTAEGDQLLILLAGGTKRRQSADIELAQALAKEWRSE